MGYTDPPLAVRKVAGGWTASGQSVTTGDDLKILANSTDTYPFIKLNGAGILDLNTEWYVALQNGALTFGSLAIDGLTNLKISAPILNGDVWLESGGGTGQIRFGTYTAGAATDSTGYITIKDGGGTTRKLMVQA